MWLLAPLAFPARRLDALDVRHDGVVHAVVVKLLDEYRARWAALGPCRRLPRGARLGSGWDDWRRHGPARKHLCELRLGAPPRNVGERRLSYASVQLACDVGVLGPMAWYGVMCRLPPRCYRHC